MTRLFLISVAVTLSTSSAEHVQQALRGAPTSGVRVSANEAVALRRLSSSDYDHEGCFKDDKTDRVLGSQLSTDDMDPEVCYEHCSGINAAYMATQYGNECWCSMEGSLDFSQNGYGTCDIICVGDDSITCGGYESFDLYKLPWAQSPDDSEEYMGCYADSRDDRVMADMKVIEDLTPYSCRDHCEGRDDSTFYATQYGNECWCGTSNDLADYDKYGGGVCHMTCAGDASVSCGGFDAFDLYMFDDSEWEGTPAPSRVHITDDNVFSDDYVHDTYSTPSPLPYVDDDSSTSSAASSSASSASTSLEVTTNTVGSDDEGDGQITDLLSIHNSVRCVHDTAGLTYSAEIAVVAQSYAEYLADSSCAELVHSDSEYGENLYYCGDSQSNSCFSASKAMYAFYDEEITDGAANTYEGHATQILWTDTTSMGCGLASCTKEGMHINMLVCNYYPAGNIMSQVDDQVLLPSKSHDECDYVPYDPNSD